jgi:hypothetical protein
MLSLLSLLYATGHPCLQRNSSVTSLGHGRRPYAATPQHKLLVGKRDSIVSNTPTRSGVHNGFCSPTSCSGSITVSKPLQLLYHHICHFTMYMHCAGPTHSKVHHMLLPLSRFLHWPSPSHMVHRTSNARVASVRGTITVQLCIVDRKVRHT